MEGRLMVSNIFAVITLSIAVQWCVKRLASLLLSCPSTIRASTKNSQDFQPAIEWKSPRVARQSIDLESGQWALRCPSSRPRRRRSHA
jgi:hypothetical protein